MANPQLENGYTPIANELLDALCKYGLTKNEMLIMLCIMRYSYGFNRKDCSISLREIAAYTDIAFQNVRKSVQTLIVKNLLFVEKSDGRNPQRYSINKDHEKWGECNQNDYSNQNNYSNQNDYSRVIKTITPHLFKKTNKNNIYICDSNQNDYTAQSLPEWFEEVWKEYPNKKGKNRISKKCYKELSEAGKETLLTAVRNYRRYCQENQWYHPQNGSTFFNGGWKDYAATLETQAPERCYDNIDKYLKGDDSNGTDPL